MGTNIKRINSIHLEARYTTAILFNDYSKLQFIIRTLNNELPLSQFENSQRILLLANTERKLNVQISDDRFIISIEEPSSYENFKNLAQNIIDRIINGLDIFSFTRIGMRTISGLEMPSAEKANEFVLKNFLRFDNKFLKNYGHDFSDYAVSFSFKEKDLKVRLNISSSIYQLIEISEGVLKKNSNTHEIRIDSDVYNDQTTNVQQLKSSFIKNVIQINKENIAKFFDDLEGQ